MSDPQDDKRVADKRYSKSASVEFLSRYRERSLRRRENSAASDIRTTRNLLYALNNGRSLYIYQRRFLIRRFGHAEW